MIRSIFTGSSKPDTSLGVGLFHGKEQDGTHESIDDAEAFISPGDFIMLINHYRTCKREHKPIF